MRIYLTRLILPVIVTFMTTSLAQAQLFDEDYVNQDGLKADVDVALRSVRMYRGQNLYDGTSLQPQGEIAYQAGDGKFYGRVFTHFGLDQSDPPQAGSAPSDSSDGSGQKVVPTGESFTEVDFDVGWATMFPMFDLQLGNRWLTYSKTTARLRDTAELYAGLEMKMLLQPRLMAAYDWDEHDGWYYETGLSQPLNLGLLGDRSTVTPSVTVGFSQDLDDGSHPIYADDGMSYFDVGVESQVPLSESLSFVPEIHYTEGEDDAANSEFWFGIGVRGALGW